MSPAPRHSVVVPAYNAPGTIRTTIESVLAQSAGDLELIVVDDGSADDTPEVVAGYAREDSRITLIRQENAGTAGARNRGLAESSGAFVSLLDNDDAWLPPHLELAEEAFAADPSAGIAYGDAWILDDETKRVHRRPSLSFYGDRAEPVASAEEVLGALLRKNFITASSATMTRDALERVGDFDASLRGTDDWDMWLRITAAGMTARQAGVEPTVLLRKRDEQQSSDLAMMVRGNTEVLRRALSRLPEGSPAHALAAERLSEDERWLSSLVEPTRGEAFESFLRKRLGPVKRAALERRDWVEAPDAVREAIREVGGNAAGPGT